MICVDSSRGYEASAEQAERCLRAIHAMTCVLGEETALDTAMPRVLAALGPAFQAGRLARSNDAPGGAQVPTTRASVARMKLENL